MRSYELLPDTRGSLYFYVNKRYVDETPSKKRRAKLSHNGGTNYKSVGLARVESKTSFILDVV